MSQGFDPTEPATSTGLQSAPVRANINAVNTHHKGASIPGNIQDGQAYLDDSDNSNVKLGIQIAEANGGLGGFIPLFEHLEDPALLKFVGFANTRKYVHNQALATNVWTVVHNLNTSTPIVQVYNQTGDMLRITEEITTIQVVDANTVTITFDANYQGNAVVLA